jgi:hypothetical protein
MNWIRKHWGQKYIAMAESHIRQLVRLAFIFLDSVSSFAPKMDEYREKIAAREEEESAQARGANVMDHGYRDLPSYMLLAKEYGIKNDDMEIGNSGSGMTVELEYQSYTSPGWRLPFADILKFWELSSDVV